MQNGMFLRTTVLTVFKGKYTDFEFITEFDENGIFHLKHDKYDFLPALSNEDRIGLWISLLATVSKAVINNRTNVHPPPSILSS
jgi:hypothetical protein